MANKNVLVLFSGGLDSTYLMWHNLQLGNNVKPQYVYLENNASKNQFETKAVYNLLDKFKHEYTGQIDDWDIFHRKSITYNVQHSVSTILPQPLFWIFSVPFICTFSRIDEVQLGYIKHDDVVDWLDSVQDFYASILPFCLENAPELRFPIINKTKQEIWDELPNHYRQEIYVCEQPMLHDDGSFRFPCGVCGSCQEIEEINKHEQKELQGETSG